MSTNIRFTPEDWQRIEQDWTAWWNHDLDRPLIGITTQSGAVDESFEPARRFAAQYPLDTPVDDILDAYERHMETYRFHADAMPQWWPKFGAGTAAAFLGSELVVRPETIWFEPGEDTAIADHNLTFDTDNVWWLRICELIEAAVKRWTGEVAVGYTDIGGGLDILASLRSTNRLLYETVDAPVEIDRLAADITQHWLRCFDELHEMTDATGRGHTAPCGGLWSPKRAYTLQCDFSYMISPDMFSRWVLPDLSACCDHLDHSFYHLDGPGELAHLDLLCGMENLGGIQWIPGAGQRATADWPEVLGRIRAAGKLCQAFVTPEGALKVVREHGGKGFMLGVAVGDDWTDEQVKDFLNQLHRADRDR